MTVIFKMKGIPARFLLAAMATAALGWNARAGETCWTEGAGQFFDAIHFCVSSTLAPGKTWRYGPENLVGEEGGQHLAWCEGARGSGIGEAITLRIDNGARFRRLLFSNGYGKTEKSYFDNARVRILNVTTDTGLRTSIAVPDQNEPVVLPLPEAAAYRWIRLEIGGVYAGNRYPDTCVDFVSPDFEYEDMIGAETPAPPLQLPDTTPGDVGMTPPALPEPEPPASSTMSSEPADSSTDPFGDLGMPDPDQLRLPEQ
ncbi:MULTISPECIES: NADase-type glycan-binding domain-containing protein [Alphaproteobacteria]|uniref:NAD glycohydrolase translocation F5/8 type C domain-containing protein n=2 Tax=Alphaproteobacteria TaxID=28211 RepID=A0A512HJD7_9HYPH|nr:MULTISPECIES: hypothetical protein [Alphaproteobacteria]GEO85559.1 hypothetical protein RNA01_24910 [Ciceribacter naphthalenivorans]GLR22086.1 hypothetical protein GCM10007920_18730 [Ciceribacter naphthalenivorans]GLT04942.1 hypothetical protein GCM10007926_18730 [Sphingomonas psychrolutea]